MGLFHPLTEPFHVIDALGLDVRNLPTSKADPDGHDTNGLAHGVEDFDQRMEPVYKWVAKALNHPAVQAYLEVLPFIGGAERGASAGASEAAAAGAAKGAEEGAASGAASGAERGTTEGAAGGEPSPAPYNRSEHYGNPSTSKAAKEIRKTGEGQSCPKCGETMESGTKNAPTAQHTPTLKSHYYSKGHKMTPAQRRAYARSAASMEKKAVCKPCQSKEGAAESRK